MPMPMLRCVDDPRRRHLLRNVCKGSGEIAELLILIAQIPFLEPAVKRGSRQAHRLMTPRVGSGERAGEWVGARSKELASKR